MKHQVETLEAFNDPDVDVVFNTAMTGDGKSLAAYLPAFRNANLSLLCILRMNLIQDQYSSLPRYKRRLRYPFTTPMLRCMATKITA